MFMNPNRYSTVMEIFFPGGFAHDYQWTTRALGMTHIAIWNDTYVSFFSFFPQYFFSHFWVVHLVTIPTIPSLTWGTRMDFKETLFLSMAQSLHKLLKIALLVISYKILAPWESRVYSFALSLAD